MLSKILTKNSIDNTNIDGARANHFSAGMRSGIVKGAFNEGRFFASASNIIALDTCELRISGHQVVIDSIETITLNDRPSTPTKYSMIAEIQVSDMSVPSFRLFIQPASVGLRQENLFKTNNGSGTYQLRIGNFTLGTTGLITDVIRTADIITGGGDGGSADIKFNATATQLSSSSQPTANIDYNEETKEYDAHFGIPAGSGTDVTIGGIVQKEWSADFAESERQKSKNLLPVSNVKSSTPLNVSDDGLITINGEVGAWSYLIFKGAIYLKAGQSYTLSIQNYVGTGKNLLTFKAQKVSGGTEISDYISTYGTEKTITPTEDMILTQGGFYFASSGVVNFSCFVQIEEGTVATDYQEYYGKTVRDKQLKEAVNKISMLPSENKIEGLFDMGITHEVWTAPANGYVYVYLVTPDTTPGFAWLGVSGKMEVTFTQATNNSAYVPVKKGDEVTLYLQYPNRTNQSYSMSRFVYAEEV